MEVFMYVLRSSQCCFLYLVVRIRRRRKKFMFTISSADEFLVFQGLSFNIKTRRSAQQTHHVKKSDCEAEESTMHEQ